RDSVPLAEAGPREAGDVGDRELAGDVLTALEPVLEVLVNAPGLVTEPLLRVLQDMSVPRGVGEEVRGLAETGALVGDLPDRPADRLPAGRRVGGQQRARLLGQVQQDRRRFEQGDWAATGAFVIDDRGDLPVRVHPEVVRVELIAARDISPPDLVLQA